jgi:deoxyadenosine/deoxycytidine kinase
MFNLDKSIDIHHFRELIANKQIYVFDGVIGAGKTTLLKLLTKHMNKMGKKTLAIYEPVDVWRNVGALDEFYKDIPGKCLEFQTFTFITRVKRIMTEILENPDYDYYILERSIWTDRYIFVELLRDVMGPIRMEMYNQWWDMWISLMPMLPNKWVFLNTSLQESIRRICIRDRFEEKNSISIEYQNNLYNKHIEFYNKLKDSGHNTIEVESEIMDKNFMEDDSVIDSIYNLVIDDN